MVTSFTIRAATLADVPTITAHRRAMFEEMGFTHRAELDGMDKNFAEWVAKKIAAKNYQHWFALDEWNAISAGAGLWLMEWPPHASDQSDRRANILNVYTLPDYRRKRLARKLTTTILDWCRANNIRTVILHASDDGRALYESLGFKPTNEMRIQLQ